MSDKLDFSKELIGRRALVTGGTRGIGAAIAQRLLDAGAKVVIAARTPNDDMPKGATFVAGDASTGEGVEAIATKALAALGGLDILVNNAGGANAFLAGSWTIPDQAWHDSMALNLFAAIRLTNAVLPALRASKAAAVVNLSSAAATMPFGPFAHYGAAKAALNYYSRTLAMELAPSGIRVNVVSPGVIATPGSEEFAKATPGFSADDWLRNIPLGRIGATEDIAEVVALLVSDRGKFLTGANYPADGGMTAR
ncbi:oxidoreductase [Rhodanobacter glycinis]|uniref:NAD(P)-dependent dehydrogenase, short-chain alcohol dehydrogenase family n=1 Tax=Rhodanobacter glycinis TaxID=582702 RepID=A0A1I4F033_9GAMM|nr:oxidoreductase [Rhodanobacter glycinis]SFL09741.1 NAD(P)-dependent dehydrogenase, short-chain alcohol dehydrogenase family [Rhodanobacter glycinis]